MRNLLGGCAYLEVVLLTNQGEWSRLQFVNRGQPAKILSWKISRVKTKRDYEINEMNEINENLLFSFISFISFIS